MCWRTEGIESAGNVAEKEFVHTFLKIQESLFFLKAPSIWLDFS